MTTKTDLDLDLAFFNANAPPKDKLRSAIGACGALAEDGYVLWQRMQRDPLWAELGDETTISLFWDWNNDFDELLATVEELRDDGDEEGAAKLTACMADLVAFKRDKLLL